MHKLWNSSYMAKNMRTAGLISVFRVRDQYINSSIELSKPHREILPVELGNTDKYTDFSVNYTVWAIPV